MPIPVHRFDDPLDFLRLLWALDHALQAASKRMLLRYGVTSPQRFAIRFVGQSPGLGAGDLARALEDHPSTVTGILRRLGERGLVRRVVHPTDRRKVLLTLTDAGRRIETAMTGTVEGSVKRAFERLTQEEILTARRVLNLLVEALGEETRAMESSSPRRG